MVRHLSQEWLDRYVELCRELPEHPGASAVLRHVVAKTPDGDVTYMVRFEDGRPIGATMGSTDDGEGVVDLAIAHVDAQAMARAELDLPVGFMQGRIKLVGSTRDFLAVQEVLQSEEHRAALAALAAETEL